MEQFAQMILDLYPDQVSQFGLIGVIWVTAAVPWALFVALFTVRRIWYGW